MNKSIYIDAEWFQNGKIFILGYAYDLRNINLIFGKNLNKSNVAKIFCNVKQIFFYGPDIAYLEKNFDIELRNKFQCVNLLKISNHYLPKNDSKKLASLEKKFKIKRTTNIYKNDIRKLVTDWKDPLRRKTCLQYNLEDVKNLILVKRALFDKYKINSNKLNEFTLK